MFGGKGKAPKAPDPNVVSAAQTQSNQQTAAFNTALNRQNTYTPYGSQTYSYTGKDPATGAPMYDENISLSPGMQTAFDSQLAQNNQLNDIAGGVLDQVRSAYSSPVDTSGLPQLRDAPAMGQYQTGYDTSNLPAIQSNVNVNGPALQGGIDMTDLPALYGANDLEGARQQTQDALYNRSSGYLDPQWAQRESNFRTRMNNQGVVEGSEAWRNALDDENRARTFEYGQARNDAIVGGGAEMQRLAQIASGNRGQMYGERANNASFNNNARQQALAEAMGLADFSNTARAQGVNEAQGAADFNNAAVGAGNADSLRAQTAGNAARSQGLSELYASRSQPMQDFNALRDTAAIEIPQFNPPPATSVAPTNTADNVWRGYEGQLDLYNARQSSQNNMMGGLAGLAGQLGSAWIMKSDARLKSNVEHVGELPDGTNVYDYDIEGRRERGVMAQEVELENPSAVMTGKDGYKRVNYTKVMARAMGAY